MASLTQLIQRVASGNQEARGALFAAAYTELRKLALSRLRDGGRNTFLETTALVHESYLRFLGTGKMRYFGGYSEAEALGLTERTVRRDWDKARLLLMTSLRT